MKVKLSIKILALALSVVMAVSLVACGSSDNTVPNNSSAGTENTGVSNAATPADTTERPKITVLTNINVDTEGTDVNDNDYIKYVEDKTNVDIELINDTSSSYTQKLYTVMASNNLPDAVMLMGNTQRADLARFA